MINISDLISKKVSKKEFDIVLDLKELCDSYETYKVLEPFKVNITLKGIEDEIFLDGNVEGSIQLTCSRCLQHFSYNIQLELHEKLTNNPENKDDELIFINNDKLNLTEIVESNVIMSLPIQRLCKEDCKGLCAYCGCDLNFVNCNCQNFDIDLRLAKLKDLFSND